MAPLTRASSVEDLEPLILLCRAGKLFDAIEWVRQGKPVAFAEGVAARATHRNPLRVAMDRGFHSLVQVLLEAGAPYRVGNYNALQHAVDLRRGDLATMLVRHGARVTDVSMRRVIEMWDAEIVDLFLSNGADLEDGKPVAWGLIEKMRPALGLLKRFGASQPRIMKQAACALRHHAFEGNVKWVSLLLWAGADPWLSGSTDPDHDEDCFNALEWAVMSGKVEVLRVKKMVAARQQNRPESARLLDHCRDSDVLALLIAEGYRPEHLPDRGTRCIASLVQSLTWASYDMSSYLHSNDRARRDLDSTRAREQLKMVHALVAHGAKWLPKDKNEIGHVRRALLMMKRDYLLEFAWMMHRYKAAQRPDVKELFRTSSVSTLLGDGLPKAQDLIGQLPESL